MAVRSGAFDAAIVGTGPAGAMATFQLARAGCGGSPDDLPHPRFNVRGGTCLSGDCPVAEYEGQAKPSFDIDSVAQLQMLNQMDQGLPSY